MVDQGFKDHFSGHAGDYARHRPGYPPELFGWLASASPGRALAWDVGAGNGQAARGLAAHFDAIHATDASANQIAHAEGPKNVHFAVEPAERCSLPDDAADLVTVGQALHWFDLPAFYAEARRVLRPGGLLAAWTYQLNEIDPGVDSVILEFFEDVIGAYWPPERVHVEAGYLDLAFPFEELRAPSFCLSSHWTVDEYLAYVDTWSAVRRYRSERNEDPLPALRLRLLDCWGGEGRRRHVRWPLALRVGESDGSRQERGGLQA